MTKPRRPTSKLSTESGHATTVEATDSAPGSMTSVRHREVDAREVPVSEPEPTQSRSGSENLVNFFERGLLSANWQVFEANGQMRIVYIGVDTANINHLVRNNERIPGIYLHYPFPSARPGLPWKPIAPAQSVDELGSLPPEEVRDALIDAYFQDIHPGFPIVDEESFRRQYSNPDDPPPLLVYQAVLLAAARICDDPQVASARSKITTTLFRRSKSLYDMRHENDRLHLVQAALLMAFHQENADTVGSNAYFWIGAAVRTSFGLGLHRRPASRHLPAVDSGVFRIYGKVWWMLLHTEVFLALDLGRPCMIRLEDFDIAELEEQHFKNLDGSEDYLVNRTFCTIAADLALLALEVSKLSAPRSGRGAEQRAVVVNRLAALSVRLPPLHDFWSCQLRVNYNLLVLILHRTSEAVDAVRLCSTAASNILTTFETMVAQKTIRLAQMSSTTAVMAAAIQFDRDVNSSQGDSDLMRAVLAHSQLERLLVVSDRLSQVWPSVKAIRRLCMTFSSRAQTQIRQQQHQKSPQEADVGQSDIIWEDFFGIDWNSAVWSELSGTTET